MTEGEDIALLDLSGDWGLTPLWCLSTPEFSLTPMHSLVKNSQTYIADPLWFYQKSSTEILQQV